MTDTGNDKINVLGKQTNWEDLYFYQKADIVYQMSFAFCNRFIHPYKDRTRDQIIQAARSCKQNIVEGLADGVTKSGKTKCARFEKRNVQKSGKTKRSKNFAHTTL